MSVFGRAVFALLNLSYFLAPEGGGEKVGLFAGRGGGGGGGGGKLVGLFRGGAFDLADGLPYDLNGPSLTRCASNLARKAGSVRISFAAEMAWNFATKFSSWPGLRSG